VSGNEAPVSNRRVGAIVGPTDEGVGTELEAEATVGAVATVAVTTEVVGRGVGRMSPTRVIVVN